MFPKGKKQNHKQPTKSDASPTSHAARATWDIFVPGILVMSVFLVYILFLLYPRTKKKAQG